MDEKKEPKHVDEAEYKKHLQEMLDHPYINSVIRDMVNNVVDQALKLPIDGWMRSAKQHGFDGIVWFEYNRVHGTDIMTVLHDRGQNRGVPPEWDVAVQQDSRLIILYHKDPENPTKMPVRIVPIVRALVEPFPE